MNRFVLLISLVLVLVVSSMWTGRAQQPAAGDDPRFTGRSDSLDAADVGVPRRRFDASARSAWHSHGKGQLLFDWTAGLRK